MSNHNICPHCKGSFSRLHQHIKQCPLEPENYERLYAFFHKHAQGGQIMPSVDYRSKRLGTGLPSATLLNTMIGEWNVVAEHFGLQPIAPNESSCPHCEQVLRVSILDAHIERCPSAPERFACIKAFVDTFSENGLLPAASVYDSKAKKTKAAVPSTSALLRHYGKWSEFADALGLRLESDVPVYDKTVVWNALRLWCDSVAEPPYKPDSWDVWADKNEQPNSRIIRRFFKTTWREVIEDVAHSTPYPMLDEEEEAQEYVGVGFRVIRSYEAVHRRGGRLYTEVRHVLR